MYIYIRYIYINHIISYIHIYIYIYMLHLKRFFSKTSRFDILDTTLEKKSWTERLREETR